MTAFEYTDTYVICYTKPGDLWVAFSIRDRQLCAGSNPKEALANCINVTDQVAESTTGNSEICLNSSHALVLTLAKIAKPIPEGECTPGVVYKYERSRSAFSLLRPGLFNPAFLRRALDYVTPLT